MRPALCALAALALTLATPTRANDGILLPPLAGKSGPHKILVYVHGASINEKNYVTISQIIQQASDLNLWVGLPHFLGDTPNPVTITSAVTGMVKRIGEAAQGNFSNPPAASDVFVAGHSLGGVFSPAVVNKQGYRGLLEFGSYVTNGLDITSTKFPVLTLGGELDGLTRATRIAVEYQKMMTLPAADRYAKPVVILPGICHSQFCEGVNVTSFGTKDLRPEVSWADAHTAIAGVAADFLSLVVRGTSGGSSDSDAIRKRFDARFEYTGSLVGGFLSARGMESSTSPDRNWCAQVQTGTVAKAAAAGPYEARVQVVHNSVSLSTAHPSINKKSNVSEMMTADTEVTVVSYASYNLNPIDVSTVPVAAKSLTCEMMSQDAIAVANSIPGAGGKPPPANQCEAGISSAITTAEGVVSPATLARFKASGAAFDVTADSLTHTGPTFLASGLDFDTKSTPGKVVVHGVSLATETTASIFPGVYECVLLSPAKAVEWMMVDGLPRIGT